MYYFEYNQKADKYEIHSPEGDILAYVNSMEEVETLLNHLNRVPEE